MVARRLMAAMLAMLVIASLVAVLLPAPNERDGEGATSARARSPAGPARAEGRLLRVSLDASVPRSETIRAHPGDQLALTVEARRPGQVELGGFGQLEDIDPPAPARFDVLVDRAGTFPVRLVASDRTIGRIVVAREAARGR